MQDGNCKAKQGKHRVPVFLQIVQAALKITERWMNHQLMVEENSQRKDRWILL